jgi:hypothetical protein
MKDEILKLKEIIEENPELVDYSDKVDDNWTMNQLSNFVNKIMTDFKELKEEENRPGFYTNLQLLLNIYDNDNPYPQNKLK